MTDWAYPDEFNTLGEVAQWVAVAGTACCVFLLLSWIILPVDKTSRHYLSLCLTTAVLFMNVSSWPLISCCQVGFRNVDKLYSSVS